MRPFSGLMGGLAKHDEGAGTEAEMALGRAREWAVLAALCGALLAGCETGTEGVEVDLTQAARLYRETADRRPDREEMERLIAALPAEQLNDLGVLYEREGRLEEAEWAYQRAVWRDPRYVTAYVNLGNVARQRGKPDQARFRYRQALALDPGSFEAANNFADVCASEEVCVEEAIERLEPMIEGAGQFRAYGLDTLGWLYHLRGQDDRAAGLLEAALAEATEEELRAVVHEHYAEVLEGMGRHAASTEHWREAKRIREGTRAGGQPDS